MSVFGQGCGSQGTAIADIFLTTPEVELNKNTGFPEDKCNHKRHSTNLYLGLFGKNKCKVGDVNLFGICIAFDIKNINNFANFGFL